MHALSAERRRPHASLRTPEGDFNRIAIFTKAWRSVRQLHGGLSVHRKLSICLRSAWRAAKMEGGKPYSSRQVDRRWPLARLLGAGTRA